MHKENKLEKIMKQIPAIEAISSGKMLPGGKKIRNISINIRNEDHNGGHAQTSSCSESESDSEEDIHEQLSKATKEIAHSKKQIHEAEQKALKIEK